MKKTYNTVDDAKRALLLKYIYDDGHSIKQASVKAGIFYPTAKAINKIYQREGRVEKKKHRIRKSKRQTKSALCFTPVASNRPVDVNGVPRLPSNVSFDKQHQMKNHNL